MKKTSIYLSFLLFISIVFGACNPFAVQGPEPAFINISEAEFDFDLTKGPRNQRVEHVEIFFENYSIGFYELPVELAVIPTQEESTLTIFPAIQENVDITHIVTYNMMETIEITQKFEIGETYDITPVFNYKESIVFDYVETFETGNSMSFDADEIDSTVTYLTTEEAANGNRSCVISTEKNGEIVTATNFLFSDLDNDGRDVFIELNYISERPLEVGLLAQGTSALVPIPWATLKPQPNWRKMYLEVSRLIVAAPANGYRLYFRTTGGTGEDADKAFIDNVKILHQP